MQGVRWHGLDGRLTTHSSGPSLGLACARPAVGRSIRSLAALFNMQDPLFAETLIEIPDFPQSCTGAPLPLVMASEDVVALIFYLQRKPAEWDGQPRSVNSASTSDVAIVTFGFCYVHSFGPPNDEAIAGHPLYHQGLKSYSAFQVLNSHWIAELEQRNAVHRNHSKSRFLANKNHYIITFHDSTFECIAKDYRIEIVSGSIDETAARIVPNIISTGG